MVFNAATLALNVAYKILSLRGHRVITTPLTFYATTNMILENDITPVFCDCDTNGNISAKSIQKILSDDKNIKVIVSVDFAWNSVDEIGEICK